MSGKSISHAISGGISGLVSMAVTYPLVTLSTNAQAKTKEQFEKTAHEEEEEEDAKDREEELAEEEEEDDLQSDKSSLTKLTFRTIPREVSQEFVTGEPSVKPIPVSKKEQATGLSEPSDEDSKKKKLSMLHKLHRLFRKLIHRLKFIITHSEKFYAGLESALIGIVAVNFVYYYVYNLTGTYLKKLNKKKTKNMSSGLTVRDSLLTGFAAGLISRILTNPIWVANTRMTVKQKMEIESKSENDETPVEKEIDVSKQNTFTVMYEIYEKEGINGLFSGMGPALFLVSSPMIQFTVFEQLKNALLRLRSKQGINKITSVEALLLGSFGKLVAILVTYPYYTIRSRMHLSTTNENSFKVLYNAIQTEGISSLYGGLNAKLLQSIVSSGLVFYFKEETMNIVNKVVDSCSSKTDKMLKTISNINFQKKVYNK